jgi:hypothetical protein
MQIENGIVSIIQLYNFITEKLHIDDVKVRVDDGILTLTQDGNWVAVPEFLNEVMIIPKGFESGKIKKKDLVALYESVAFIAQKQGKVPDYYMESYIVPEKFGFSVWSRYPNRNIPGIKYVNTFKFKVRNKFGFII